LSKELKDQILSHLDVLCYIEKTKDNPVVSAALENEARFN